MGLDLSVGYLADLIENDIDQLARERERFERLNEFLCRKGLPPHHEPENVVPFSYQMWSYSGLHYLRRIAAHLDLRGTLPPPGDKDASKDPVLLRYYDAGPERSKLMRWLYQRSRRPHTFAHLVHHSDAVGYYLPRDFADVLLAPAETEIPGFYIGSSVRLRAECLRLATQLELPTDLDPESEEVWSAADAQDTNAITWRRYGIESFTCLHLLAAADHSIKTGAAIVFC